MGDETDFKNSKSSDWQDYHDQYDASQHYDLYWAGLGGLMGVGVGKVIIAAKDWVVVPAFSGCWRSIRYITGGCLKGGLYLVGGCWKGGRYLSGECFGRLGDCFRSANKHIKSA